MPVDGAPEQGYTSLTNVIENGDSIGDGGDEEAPLLEHAPPDQSASQNVVTDEAAVAAGALPDDVAQAEEVPVPDDPPSQFLLGVLVGKLYFTKATED